MSVIAKKYITVFWALALLLQTFSKAIIVVDFYANQDYIARNLCVNRTRPVIHCGGRCLLTKKLAEDDGNKDKSSPERKTTATGDPLSSETAFVGLTVPGDATLRHIPGRCDNRIVDRPSFCFQPPD